MKWKQNYISLYSVLYISIFAFLLIPGKKVQRGTGKKATQIDVHTHENWIFTGDRSMLFPVHFLNFLNGVRIYAIKNLYSKQITNTLKYLLFFCLNFSRFHSFIHGFVFPFAAIAVVAAAAAGTLARGAISWMSVYSLWYAKNLFPSSSTSQSLLSSSSFYSHSLK